MTTDDWTTPGVYEVVPGVHRIPLPLPSDGLRAVNVYVVVGTDGSGKRAIPDRLARAIGAPR